MKTLAPIKLPNLVVEKPYGSYRPVTKIHPFSDLMYVAARDNSPALTTQRDRILKTHTQLTSEHRENPGQRLPWKPGSS